MPVTALGRISLVQTGDATLDAPATSVVEARLEDECRSGQNSIQPSMEDQDMDFSDSSDLHAQIDCFPPPNQNAFQISMTRSGIENEIARRVAERTRELEILNQQLIEEIRTSCIGALTASVVHEVNQPLSGIITNGNICVGMLDDSPPNIDGAKDAARRIIRDGNRTSEVLVRLRKLFSRKGRVAESVDLNDAIRDVIDLSLADLRKSQIVLRQELTDTLPQITGDRVQLQQVILNLLRNSVDALATADDQVRTIVVRTEHDGEYVCMSVEDSGTGFDPEFADQLFEYFFTTKPDGMGIGLSISRSIIELHNGKLWAINNNARGATFGFRIPIIQPRPTNGKTGVSGLARVIP